jgi:molybdenum cofactor cytidylyltransferase
MESQTKIGIILLSAGESARMGQPKQLLKFKGKTLLQLAAQTATASVCGSIVAVLGANAEIFQKELYGFDLEIVYNEDWKTGMSSSIKAGLNKLLEINNALKGVVIMVCDQPFLTAEIINTLVEKYLETDALIVASKYAETLGVPALFDKKLFDELKNLNERSGAKSLIKRFQDKAVSIDFPAGEFDIDTPEDYSGLLEGGFLG